jgi:hypothetical protein
MALIMVVLVVALVMVVLVMVRSIRITLYPRLTLQASCSAESAELDRLDVLKQPYQLQK